MWSRDAGMRAGRRVRIAMSAAARAAAASAAALAHSFDTLSVPA